MNLRLPTFNDITNYYEIVSDVITLDKRIRELIQCDYTLYKGLQILMTPLVINPKVMIVGINPGSGYFHNYRNEGLQESNPIYSIDHRPNNIDLFSDKYTICQLIKSCFSESDFQSLKRGTNNNIVWSNICPIATDQANEYRKLLDMVGTGYAWKTIHRIIHQLTALINPQLILCLGKEAFEEYCNNQFINDLDMIEKLSSGVEHVFEAKTKSHIPIIGVSRNHNSLQCNKIELQKLVHSYINQDL